MPYAETFPFLLGALLSLFPFVAYAQTPFVDPLFDIRNTGQAMSTCSSGLSKEVQISSQCRQLCAEDATCVAFYTYPFSYRWKCFLFFYGTPHRWKNSTRPNEITGVKRYPGSALEADGFYYILLSKESLNFTSAREDCKFSPWFRLALLKIKLSLFIATSKYQKSCFPSCTSVDLQQNIDNDKATFGDGTAFEDSPIAKDGITLAYNDQPRHRKAVFSLYNGNFDDESSERVKTALCQGDPLMLMT